MSAPAHIINRQVLEIHMSETADVAGVQEAMSRLYQEKLVPIIGAVCDRLSQGGMRYQIEALNVDLGVVQLEEIPEVFAEKLAAAIEAAGLQEVALPEDEGPAATPPQSSLDALSYYLLTGTTAWWVTTPSKAYLGALLDAHLAEPDSGFKALLQETGQNPGYRKRFLQTFSRAQLLAALRVLAPHALDEMQQLCTEVTEIFLRKRSWFATEIRPQRLENTFWAAVFAQLTLATTQTDLPRQVVQQTLRDLEADMTAVLAEVHTQQSAPGIGQWLDPNRGEQLAEQQKLIRAVKNLQQNHRDNAHLQAFSAQLSRLLQHPLFPRLDARAVQELQTLLQRLSSAQKSVDTRDTTVAKVITETNLQPLARQVHALEQQLRRMTPTPSSSMMEKLQSSFDETEFITVQNAGLVILWPFLQRFFENLDLVHERAFHSETAQNKAACMLQHLLGESEEDWFEGDFPLNKVLTGIPLGAAVALEPVLDHEAEIAEGLLRAVMARGPYWKNLSLSGFRSSYLRREGLLRSRDGHWLLQVKKETHDITLEKLPWGFNAVKLPWMNQILLVEWM